jgi:hypothetical protein
MFIKTVKKKNKGNPKVFEYQQLVESIRTEKGPRQRFLLDLGKLELPKEDWPLLAKRINDIIHGQENLFCAKPVIERLANQYAQALMRKYEADYDDTPKDYQAIDVNSVNNTKQRTIGAEYVVLSILKKLALDQCFLDLNLSERQREVASLLTVGRMVKPGSERKTHLWAQHLSGLDSLLATDFSRLSRNTLYSVSDKLYEHKDIIESHLRNKERDLFSLKERIILYDLTNTFFEGRALANPKARFGKSKDKRSDCRLLTLGLVIDGKGFPKTSKIFSGNQSEPKTLVEMVESLRKMTGDFTPKASGQTQMQIDQPTVVIDAGIATEENLKELKKHHYHYVCVSRKKLDHQEPDDMIVLNDKPDNKIAAKRITKDGEIYLYCKSEPKRQKEKSMQTRLEQHFEEELKTISKSIHKKGCTKNYQKVCERIGRLRERYSRISHYYNIIVEEKNGLANRITWQYIKDQADQNFSGSYYLRTDRTELSEKQIWDIYIMLKELEDAFRSMKSEIGLRPNYHQTEHRSDSHIFITVIAYHILNTIKTTLKQNGLYYSWDTIRMLLATHTIGTTRLNTSTGKTIHIRKCSEAEPFHKLIYDALKLNYVPCKPQKVES